MGFSLIGATVVLGVSIFMATQVITGGLLPTITDINESYNELNKRMVDEIHTTINITSVSTVVNGTGYDYNITVENAGSVSLETNDFTVMINGIKLVFTPSQSHLYPENNVHLVIRNVSGTGSKRVKVVTSNGISDYYIHIIP